MRSAPVRARRATSVGVCTNLTHVTWFNFNEHLLNVFDPILSELSKRISGKGSGSLLHHHIAERLTHTRALFFETTYLLTQEMQDQLNDFISMMPDWDRKPRKCIRSLANHYCTTVNRSSKDCTPLMDVHRDNINDADLSIVLGITDRSEFRGSLLYVSTVASTGKVHFNKTERPCRKSVVGIDVLKGVCVVLKNNVEHYVGTLQSGKRGSIVFHMSSK